MVLLNIPAGRELKWNLIQANIVFRFSGLLNILYVIDTKFIRYSIGLLYKLVLSVEEKADVSLRVLFSQSSHTVRLLHYIRGI